MDFLKIRKKARERAAARSAPTATPTPTSTSSPAADPTGGPFAAADPAGALRDAAELEGALAARLEGASPLDAGFLTWRPGSSPAPILPEPPVPAAEPPEPRSEDFTLVTHAPIAAASVAAAALAPADPPAPPPPATPARRDALDEFFYRPDEETPELPDIGGPAEPAPADDVDSAVREEYLTFLLGREEYAVAIERVREVVRAPPVTEVPRAPAHVLGVATVRGEVVAVMDPRRRLGLPGATPVDGAGRIVIVDAGDGPCALLVDAVASVVRLPPGAIEACPQGFGGARAEFLAGIGRDGDRLFTVLDLGALLRRTQPGARRAAEEGPRAVR